MEENKAIKGGLRELQAKPQKPLKMKYVLYARKSTEAEEKQALSESE